MTKAAALSYTVSLSLVPLAATWIAFLTVFPGLQSERDRLMSSLSSQLLPSAVQSAQNYIQQFSERAAATGVASLLIFFVFVLMMFRSLESAFNDIWRLEKARTWRRRLRALVLFLVTGAIATAVFIVLEKGIAGLFEYISGLESLSLGQNFAQVSVFLTSLFVAWALFSISNRVLPNTEVKWSSAMIGGAVVGTLWNFLKFGFSWYIENVASYNSIYGALGVIPVFFLWVFLSFLLLLTGGYISFVVQDLKKVVFSGRSQDQESLRNFYAVAVSVALERASYDRQAPISGDQIKERLQIPAYFVAEALESLRLSGFVSQVREGSEERYFLTKPGKFIALHRLIQGVSGDMLATPDWAASSVICRSVARIFRDGQARFKNDLGKATIADFAKGLDRVDTSTSIYGS